MGHPGAIVCQRKATFKSKEGAFGRPGIPVANYSRDVKGRCSLNLKWGRKREMPEKF